MNHQLLARVGLSFLTAVQGIATVAIDLNRTHATNPLWTGHARFHVVWQSFTVVLLSLFGLLLIWYQGPLQAERFYLSALLAALSPLGFISALMSRKLFGGTLSDPNGIGSLKAKSLGFIRSIDLNLAAVVVALISLLAILCIFQD